MGDDDKNDPQGGGMGESDLFPWPKPTKKVSYTSARGTDVPWSNWVDRHRCQTRSATQWHEMNGSGGGQRARDMS